jgi:hypothetical protein
VFLLPRNRLFGVSVPKGACNVVQTGNRDANSTTTITVDPILAGLLSGRGWGDVIQSFEDSADAVFINMTEFDYQREKTIAKNTRRFGSWNAWLAWVQRIDSKRRSLRIMAATTFAPTKLDDLIDLRRDYTTQSHIYFATPIERDAQLYKLDAQIRRERGGSERLDAVIACQNRKALPEILATIQRVKRQAAALRNLPKVIAAGRIAHFLSLRFRFPPVDHFAGVCGRRPGVVWDGDGTYGPYQPTEWDVDLPYVPEPEVPVRTDEEKVRAFLKLRPCDSISPSTFAVMLAFANADEKNGTVQGVSPAIYKKCCVKPMSSRIRKLSPAIAAGAAEVLERGIAAASEPEKASWKYRDVGIFGDTNEDDNGEDSDDDDPVDI